MSRLNHLSSTYSEIRWDKRFLSIGILSSLIFAIGDRLDAFYICLIFKPMPIACLILWIIWKTKFYSVFIKFITAGMIFSMIGDIVLGLSHRDAFIQGLVCFLVGHACYTIAFHRIGSPLPLFHKLAHLMPLSTIYIVTIGYFLHKLNINVSETFEDLKMPVAIYSLLLTFACFQASIASSTRRSLSKQNSKHQNQTIKLIVTSFHDNAPIIGIILFIISDTILALDTFLPQLYHTPFTRIIYIAAYYGAQWFIAHTTCDGTNLNDFN